VQENEANLEICGDVKIFLQFGSGKRGGDQFLVGGVVLARAEHQTSRETHDHNQDERKDLLEHDNVPPKKILFTKALLL
jgi:hypothetical protein